MKVAAVQHDIVWESPQENYARLAPKVAEAAAAGARLVVLTEMYATGFSMDTGRVAEPAEGPSTDFLRRQAADCGVWVCGSVAVREGTEALACNRLVLAGPDGTLHAYDKIHPFSYGGEHRHYRAGSRHVSVDVEGVRLSLFVCYDLRFADEFWVLAQDTDCYLVVANWPAVRQPHWSALLTARAIENQAYVVGVNRVGEGGGIAYTGASAVIDPLGALLAAAGDEETILYAEVSPETVAEVRARYPFLQDRR